MGCIRGAVCVDNTEKDIGEKTVELFDEIIVRNSLDLNAIQAVFFTATDDIDACYPAKFVREKYGLCNVAFMCFREMNVVESLDHCLRVCVFVENLAQSDCKHCYTGRAASLRSDLYSGKS